MQREIEYGRLHPHPFNLLNITMDNFFNSKKWITWLLGGLWLMAVIIAVIWRLRSTNEPQLAATPDAPPRILTVDELIANVPSSNYDGSLDAPVKLVVFSDFDCPFCKAWRTRNLRASLKEQFGDQLAIVFRHYPSKGDSSWQVAEASQCAGAQGKFWEFHDHWFEHHTIGQTTEAEITAAATELKLDLDLWQACRDSGQFAEHVRQDFQLAQSTGYLEPPIFFVNDQHVPFKIAAQSNAIFQAILSSCPEPCGSTNE
ncbi:MAG: thioredoxin domain-containing protein [Ardenticatenaceae bacterium]|nr:thioredoxin domain-containing protein [Ardenticatenaceae bacterium]